MKEDETATASRVGITFTKIKVANPHRSDEALGLMVNPVTRQLLPMRLLLAQIESFRRSPMPLGSEGH